MWRDLRGLRLLAQPKDCYPVCPSATTMKRSIVQKLEKMGREGPRASNNYSGCALRGVWGLRRHQEVYLCMSETCSPPRASRSRISDCEQELLAQGQPRWERTFGSTWEGGRGHPFDYFELILSWRTWSTLRPDFLGPVRWLPHKGHYDDHSSVPFSIACIDPEQRFQVADKILIDAYSCS